jgi:hypothetical protein
LNEAAAKTLRGVVVVWPFDTHVGPAQGFAVWRV